MNCTREIDVVKFEKLCRDVTESYVSLYPWWWMPTTVHKILIHGGLIMRKAWLPIGMLNEEAQEAQNEVYRHLRLFQARMIDRKATNEDALHMMRASLKPFISLLRQERRINAESLDFNLRELLRYPENVETEWGADDPAPDSRSRSVDE